MFVSRVKFGFLCVFPRDYSQMLPLVQGIPWHQAVHELPVGPGVLDVHPHQELPSWAKRNPINLIVIKYGKFRLHDICENGSVMEGLTFLD